MRVRALGSVPPRETNAVESGSKTVTRQNTQLGTYTPACVRRTRSSSRRRRSRPIARSPPCPHSNARPPRVVVGSPLPRTPPNHASQEGRRGGEARALGPRPLQLQPEGAIVARRRRSLGSPPRARERENEKAADRSRSDRTLPSSRVAPPSPSPHAHLPPPARSRISLFPPPFRVASFPSPPSPTKPNRPLLRSAFLLRSSILLTTTGGPRRHA